MGVSAAQFAGQFFFDIGELIGEAAGVDKDDAALDDAVVFEVGIE